MLGQGRCKGTVLIHLREFVEQEQGGHVWTEVLSELPEEDRAVFGGIIIVGGWYPVRTWNRALRAFLPRAFTDGDAGMRALSAFIADRDLNTLYKIILRMGTPEFLLRRTESLWGRYFDVGEFTAGEVGKHRWHLELSAPRGEEAAPDGWTCGPGVSAWLEMGLRQTGASATVRHVRCRLVSSKKCEYDVTW
jgi:hypothetical protein